MMGAVTTRSVEETVRKGEEFGQTLRRGYTVGLVGPLGSGKTHFVRGVCAAFGFRGEVLSPSFVLMHRYDGADSRGKEIVINHFDFYRIRRIEELDDIGFRDLTGGETLTLIEWADAFPDALPPGTLTVRFEHGEDPDVRTIELPSNPAVES